MAMNRHGPLISLYICIMTINSILILLSVPEGNLSLSHCAIAQIYPHLMTVQYQHRSPVCISIAPWSETVVYPHPSFNISQSFKIPVNTHTVSRNSIERHFLLPHMWKHCEMSTTSTVQLCEHNAAQALYHHALMHTLSVYICMSNMKWRACKTASTVENVRGRHAVSSREYTMLIIR